MSLILKDRKLIEPFEKIFVAGHKGMVGSAIKRSLIKKGYTNLFCQSRKELNLLNFLEVENWFRKNSFNLYIQPFYINILFVFYKRLRIFLDTCFIYWFFYRSSPSSQQKCNSEKNKIERSTVSILQFCNVWKYLCYFRSLFSRFNN